MNNDATHNDAITTLARQRAAHKATAKKLTEDMRQLANQHRLDLQRVEAEYEAKRAELLRTRHNEERAVTKLTHAITNEQAAEARRQREEAEITAHIERLRPALARLGMLTPGG